MGIQQPPNPIIGKDDLPGAPARPQTPPPGYDDVINAQASTQPVEVMDGREHTQLSENPLWSYVQSELERKPSRFYDWVCRDPVRRARYTGLKQIALLHFPLINDVFRAFWSAWQMLIFFLIAGLQYGFSSPQVHHEVILNCSYPYPSYLSRKYVRKAYYAEDVMVAVVVFLAMADFLFCTSYCLQKRLCGRSCSQRGNEEQPLVGGGQRLARWRALANWWDRYSDIPRFKVSEALFVIIYYLGLGNRLYSEFSFILALIAISQYVLILLLQIGILVVVVYGSTCRKQKFGVHYRAVGFLSAFVVHFAAQLLFSVLLICSTSYIYATYGVRPASHEVDDYDYNYSEAVSNAVALATFTLLVGCFMVSMFTHLTFFTLTYGWLKYICTKTFKDFLDHLNHRRLNSTSQQEKRKIKAVLDEFQYEVLNSPTQAWRNSVGYLPGAGQIIVLGLLLTTLLGLLAFVVYGVWFPSQFHRTIFWVFLPLALLLNIVYILVAIVWPVYVFIDVVGWCCFKCGK